MKIIGLTGGIGSGKTTVLNFFKEFGIPVYVADIEAKKILNSSSEVIEKVKKLFGEKAYNDQGLNSKFIAEIVFADTAKLKALNKIVHPAVHSDFQEFVKNQNAAYIVYESALLFENKSENQFDKIILVVTPLAERIKRVQKRDQMTVVEIEARIKNQMTDAIKVKKADYILLNADLTELKIDVLALHQLFLS